MQTKIIRYRTFALIDTRSACMPFHSPLPQKGSSVAISLLPLFFPLLLLIFATEVSKKKVDFASVEEFSSVSGGIVKADSIYRSFGGGGVTAFRNLHLFVPSSPW